MNSFLTFIAGLIVTLLLAALIGPSFVDWNQYRAGIEAQASKASGREVRIEGDIDFSVLPSPHIQLNKVTISQATPAGDDMFARFDAVDAEVALAPLFGGEISITHITIIRPEIHLVVDAKGEANWRDLISEEAASREGAFSLAATSLDAAKFQDGTLSYVNQQSGHSWLAQDITGSVTATSLLGPMRGDFDMNVNDVPMSLKLGLAYFGGNKAFPVTLEADLTKSDTKFLFSGLATEFSATARLDGNGSIEYGKAPGSGGDDALPPVRVEAGLVATGSGATFRDLAVMMAGTTLKGKAEAKWEGRPYVSIDLATDALTLDPLADRFEKFTAANGQLLKAISSLDIPTSYDADLAVDVEGLMTHDALIRKASLRVSLEKGVLDIGTARGEIGGTTQVSVNGLLRPGEGGNRFQGEMTLVSQRLSELAMWLNGLRHPGKQEGPLASLRLKGQNQFALTSQLDLAADTISFKGIKAAYATTVDDTALSGDVSYQMRADANDVVTANLRARDFDFDPLLALQPVDGASGRTFLQSHDLGLKINADSVTAFETKLSGLQADLLVQNGKAHIETLEIADVVGAKISLKADLSGVTTGVLADLQGSFTGRIEAEKFGELLTLAGYDVPAFPAELALDLTGQSGEADDAQVRLDTLTLKGLVGDSRVDAVVKRRHENEGGVDRVDILANAVNANGADLLRQLRFSPAIDNPGPGNASLRMTATSDSDYDTEFRLNVGDAVLKTAGTMRTPLEGYSFKGKLDIDSPDLARLFSLYGAPEALADFAERQADGTGVVVSSGMQADRTQMHFENIEVVAGNLRLSGMAGFQRSQDENDNGRLTGDLVMNRLDLGGLMGLPVAPTEAAFDWPATALGWQVLGQVDADMSVKIDQLLMGPATFEKTDMKLELTGGVMNAESAAAEFAGGRATLSAKLTGGAAEPALNLLVAVDDGNLDAASKELVGVPFATGPFDGQLQIAGQGRSWLALVSSMKGMASLTSKGGALTPLYVDGFGKALVSLEKMDGFPPLVQDVLMSGTTSFDDLSMASVISDGVMGLKDQNVKLDGGEGTLSASLDLPRLAMTSRLDVRLDELEKAPAFAITSRGRTGAMETRTDTGALENFIAARLIAKQAEDLGVGALPPELSNLIGSAANDNADSRPAKAGGVALPLARP
ncbi:MAG: AsmA family protein [Rhizobiales bacterium]|nr:AsmA family protein [Hyphomicrobiales bacterium]